MRLLRIEVAALLSATARLQLEQGAEPGAALPLPEDGAAFTLPAEGVAALANAVVRIAAEARLADDGDPARCTEISPHADALDAALGRTADGMVSADSPAAAGAVVGIAEGAPVANDVLAALADRAGEDAVALDAGLTGAADLSLPAPAMTCAVARTANAVRAAALPGAALLYAVGSRFEPAALARAAGEPAWAAAFADQIGRVADHPLTADHVGAPPAPDAAAAHAALVSFTDHAPAIAGPALGVAGVSLLAAHERTEVGDAARRGPKDAELSVPAGLSLGAAFADPVSLVAVHPSSAGDRVTAEHGLGLLVAAGRCQGEAEGEGRPKSDESASTHGYRSWKRWWTCGAIEAET